MLRRAAAQRFGGFGWVVLCRRAHQARRLAALVKPFVFYAAPQLIIAWRRRHGGQLTWFQWAPVVAWIGFLFEYLSRRVHADLLHPSSRLLCGLRGPSPSHNRTCIGFRDPPLQLSFEMGARSSCSSVRRLHRPPAHPEKNFPAFQSWFLRQCDHQRRPPKQPRATCLLDVHPAALVPRCQITARSFIAKSLLKALRDHLAFRSTRYVWPFGWFSHNRGAAFSICSKSQPGLVVLAGGLGEGKRAAGVLLEVLAVPWGCAAPLVGGVAAPPGVGLPFSNAATTGTLGVRGMDSVFSERGKLSNGPRNPRGGPGAIGFGPLR